MCACISISESSLTSAEKDFFIRKVPGNWTFVWQSGTRCGTLHLVKGYSTGCDNKEVK